MTLLQSKLDLDEKDFYSHSGGLKEEEDDDHDDDDDDDEEKTAKLVFVKIIGIEWWSIKRAGQMWMFFYIWNNWNKI